MRNTLTNVLNTILTTIPVLIFAYGPRQFLAYGSQEPFTLKLAASRETVKAGSEVCLEITLTNTSDKDIQLTRPPGEVTAAEFSYAIEVRDDNGEPVPETRYGRFFKQHGMVRGSRVSYVLKPGESLKDETILNQLYDLSMPGKYVIQVSRAIPEVLGIGKGSAKSNPITITIIP